MTPGNRKSAEVDGLLFASGEVVFPQMGFQRKEHDGQFLVLCGFLP